MAGRLFITGDTHRTLDIESVFQWANQEGKGLAKNDTLIIAGDFGFPWPLDMSLTENEEDKDYLDRLENEVPCTVAFIDGNHECFPVLSRYPETEWHGGKVQPIRPHVLHLMRGQVFKVAGFDILAFGGARSMHTIGRREGMDYWEHLEQATAQEMEECVNNMESHGGHVDIAITHTAPSSVCRWIDPIIENSATSQFLEHLDNRFDIKTWYIGHYHRDEDKGDFRLVYNRILEA